MKWDQQKQIDLQTNNGEQKRVEVFSGVFSKNHTNVQSKRCSYPGAQKGSVLLWVLVIALIALGVAFFIPHTSSTDSIKAKVERDGGKGRAVSGEIEGVNGEVLGAATSTLPIVPTITHVTTPKSVKAVYISSWVGGTEGLRSKIVDLIEKTEINAVVLDIKDYTGMISFMPESEKLQSIGCIEVRIKDIKPFIQSLHDKNIYVIGRVAVFQDPCMVKKEPSEAVKRRSDGSVWKDKNGISWIDAGSQKIWDYDIEIARTAHNMGFDEINFDYIRYPSDGNMLDIAFPVSGDRSKSDTLQAFFKYLDKELRGGRAASTSDPVFDELVAQYGLGISSTTASKPDISLDGRRVETPIDQSPRMVTSADLFGLVTNNDTDMGIGQVLVKLAPYVDFIGPMVYPSHYPNNFIGIKNPAAEPYKVIDYALKGGVTRMHNISLNPLKIRPWLQDFNLGATYTADMVRKQIKATYDNNLTGWMLWDASNTYTPGGALPITSISASAQIDENGTLTVAQ